MEMLALKLPSPQKFIKVILAIVQSAISGRRWRGKTQLTNLRQGKFDWLSGFLGKEALLLGKTSHVAICYFIHDAVELGPRGTWTIFGQNWPVLAEFKSRHRAPRPTK